VTQQLGEVPYDTAVGRDALRRSSWAKMPYDIAVGRDAL
jgi:hypothetical protein